MSEPQKVDFAEVIAEEFGANATYVRGCWTGIGITDLVDDSWRAYFNELLRDGSGTTQSANGGGSATAVEPQRALKVRPRQRLPEPQKISQATAVSEDAEVVPLRGAALKIVENMEASLSVPTATSQRRIPVKLLDENRGIINKYLTENDRSKTSYTHLIAWAILRALEGFHNSTMAMPLKESSPLRVKRPHINLGIAIDIAKKDGSRTLLVPNISRNSPFLDFLSAYDDVVRRARKGNYKSATSGYNRVA